MRASDLEPQSIELADNPRMNRVKNFFKPDQAYEPVANDTGPIYEDEESISGSEDGHETPPFSWISYGVFVLLGIAMLWAWNMFMAAAPYFHDRFESNDWILNHFQPAEVSVSTVTSLVFLLILSKLQENASYPRRIITALIISSVTFGILAVSTLFTTPAPVYFGFLLITVFTSSLGTSLIQNGLFAFAAGFGKHEYIQGIMTGQGIAGVLPPLVQIVSVMAIKHDPEVHVRQSPPSAFVYFVTAVGISVVALLAFLYLLRTGGPGHLALDKDTTARLNGNENIAVDEIRGAVPLLTLFKKLTFLSLSVFLCFAITMVFPVFTTSVFSTSGIDPAVFIPLAFLIWNIGDLAGRLSTAIPSISLTYYPFALFCLAMARLLFIPLYFLCNIKNRGAIISSDAFYLIVVQFFFGLTNGYLGSSCMMGAADWVLPEEREAAGGFMSLMLVGGLAVGSLLSFLLGGI